MDRGFLDESAAAEAAEPEAAELIYCMIRSHVEVLLVINCIVDNSMVMLLSFLLLSLSLLLMIL